MCPIKTYIVTRALPSILGLSMSVATAISPSLEGNAAPLFFTVLHPKIPDPRGDFPLPFKRFSSPGGTCRRSLHGTFVVVGVVLSRRFFFEGVLPQKAGRMILSSPPMRGMPSFFEKVIYGQRMGPLGE